MKTTVKILFALGAAVLVAAPALRVPTSSRLWSLSTVLSQTDRVGTA
jgi:hypothetical protein